VNQESFEDQYLDVLQNIETGILTVYRKRPEMTDWDALSAIEALIRAYRSEAAGRQPAPPRLNPIAQEVYDFVRLLCEWRLGHTTFPAEIAFPDEMPEIEPLTLDEIVACLKRIRKSINRWTKEGGRRGYLTFINEFIP